MDLPSEEQDGSYRLADSAARLSGVELERAVRAADPAAFFLPPRILRRVIKEDRGLAGFGLYVPHRKSYLIEAAPLLEIVERSELSPDDGGELPGKLILLPQPTSQKLASLPAGDLLVFYWRLLFHSRVHLALEARTADGRLSAELVHERIAQIGFAEFDEIRLVLQQEDFLLPPRSDESTYIEFAAVHLELQRFAPSFLPRFFPGLQDAAAVSAVLAQDIDAGAIFEAVRPDGAPQPFDRCEIDRIIDETDEAEVPEDEAVLDAEPSSESKYRFLMRKSQRPAALGNVVRAAIYRARAERCAPPEMLTRVRSAIRMDLYRLIRRLQAALELDDSSPQPWQESLFALTRQTPRGIWTAEARLLYDLQKVCVDHERDIYTVDLVEWALSLGRRPIKRPLPNQRDVLMSKHLRTAAQRLAVVRLSDSQRQQLGSLIEAATVRVESRLRQHLRPVIAAVILEVGLQPQNLPETVARDKLIEELLDQIAERGFLTMGALRDAISRNNLKLPDLSEPADLWRGDQLLRADRLLAVTLDGVYHGGEVYLRWMQRLSALGFGTRIGRFLTRFAVVPFVGSYVVLAGAKHLWEILSGAEAAVSDELVEVATAAVPASPSLHATSPEFVVALGIFLLLLVNSPLFRSAIGRFFKASFRIFHALAVEPIKWLVLSPWLWRIVLSRPFRLLLRFIFKPLLWTAAAWAFVPADENWPTKVGTAASIFLGVNLLLNSRVGRKIEELALDWIVRGWHRFGLRFIMGLFWLIVDVFKGFVESVERMMYAVDEWLRFKSGESPLTLGAKAVFGLLWFAVAYVVRFAVNVLLEPQINPIKHFPVVTVGHKLLLPAYKPFADLLMAKGMGEFAGWGVSFAVIWGIPGIFGFLVWELKENWRLYAANRRRQLAPVMIGSHGENMGRLLKPGFYSGTLPKRYAKVRRAERKARVGGDWGAVRKHLHALHHVEVAIRRYIEREFLALFAQSRCWQAPLVVLEDLGVGTNCVKITLGQEGRDAAESLQVAFAVEAGWLVADIVRPGWIETLQPQQREILTTALLGLYKSAGVELIRQQIDAEFQPPPPPFDVTPTGLVVWPDDRSDVEVVYEFDDSDWIAPQNVRGLARRALPTLERSRLLFAALPISWERWVEAWENDRAGQGHPRGSVAPARVLPC